jgi:predicted ATPase
MIKRIYIDNYYKSLVNFELQLQELTLLLGPNGVGKTSVDVPGMATMSRHVTGSAVRRSPARDLRQAFPGEGRLVNALAAG